MYDDHTPGRLPSPATCSVVGGEGRGGGGMKDPMADLQQSPVLPYSSPTFPYAFCVWVFDEILLGLLCFLFRFNLPPVDTPPICVCVCDRNLRLRMKQCTMLRCVAVSCVVCCSALQCVAVCCSVLSSVIIKK